MGLIGRERGGSFVLVVRFMVTMLSKQNDPRLQDIDLLIDRESLGMILSTMLERVVIGLLTTRSTMRVAVTCGKRVAVVQRIHNGGNGRRRLSGNQELCCCKRSSAAWNRSNRNHTKDIHTHSLWGSWFRSSWSKRADCSCYSCNCCSRNRRCSSLDSRRNYRYTDNRSRRSRRSFRIHNHILPSP